MGRGKVSFETAQLTVRFGGGVNKGLGAAQLQLESWGAFGRIFEFSEKVLWFSR